MERRVYQRYDAGLLLDDLTEVVVIFPDKQEVAATVVDISSQGMRVSIPSSKASFSIPQKIEMVEIVFVAIQLRLACRYIFSMKDQNDNVLIGFYVFDPVDQSKLRSIMDRID
ncbi:MAG: PilZ domain-containing protein [Desulfuromonadaceae bacterium]|nr:PilZ domain-containing protein [Desulfuromonadaceae bacterium]